MKLELQSGKREWAMTFPIFTCCWRRSSAALATRNVQTFGTLQSCRARGQQATRYDKSATVVAGTTSKLSVLSLLASFSSLAFAAADSQTGDERTVRQNT